MQWNRPYTYAEYKEYIETSQQWQLNRMAVFPRENYTCQWCGATKVALHCHHTPEAYKFPLGQEPLGLLKCLCEDCHAWYHQKGGKLPAKLKYTDTPIEMLNEEAPSWGEIEKLMERL